MVRLEFTPWRNDAELLTVRHQLYPLKDTKEPDMRRKACNKIYAWKLRGGLPHAVESTACITDAMLHDDPTMNSPFTIRAVYATAFSRFVTGLTDSGQDSKRKRSMYKVGKDIGIPASFVELRHQTTHEDLPSLTVFRRAAERALRWLYHYYWRYIDMPEPSDNLVEDEIEAFDNGVEKLKERLRQILRTHLKAQLEALKKSARKAATEPPDGVVDYGRQLVKICKDNEETLKELVKVLLERKMLVPTARTLGARMDDVFILWDGLLRRLTNHQRLFLILLTNEMSLFLIQPSMLDTKIDEYREAITLWLEHIYTDDQWAAACKRGNLDINVILSTCLMNPNYWTLHLAARIIEDSKYKLIRNTYKAHVMAASEKVKIAYPGSIRSGSGVFSK